MQSDKTPREDLTELECHISFLRHSIESCRDRIAEIEFNTSICDEREISALAKDRHKAMDKLRHLRRELNEYDMKAIKLKGEIDADVDRARRSEWVGQNDGR